MSQLVSDDLRISSQRRWYLIDSRPLGLPVAAQTQRVGCMACRFSWVSWELPTQAAPLPAELARQLDERREREELEGL